MSKEVQMTKVNGRWCIGTSALIYCNTKYHAPYLGVIGPDGNLLWQDKEYVGYGKHRETYYVVEGLKAGDLIQAAGGSGTNKYPFHGRVISVDLETGVMEVEDIPDKEWGNVLAELKRQSTAEFNLSKEEMDLVDALRALPEDRRRLVIAEAQKQK